MTKIARWSHLLELHKLEAEGLVKMSKLTQVSVYPEPINEQSKATCLRVFCEETYITIISHPVMRNSDERGLDHIAVTIKIEVNGKKLNVKSIGLNIKFKYRSQVVE